MYSKIPCIYQADLITQIYKPPIKLKNMLIKFFRSIRNKKLLSFELEVNAICQANKS